MHSNVITKLCTLHWRSGVDNFGDRCDGRGCIWEATDGDPVRQEGSQADGSFCYDTQSPFGANEELGEIKAGGALPVGQSRPLSGKGH